MSLNKYEAQIGVIVTQAINSGDPQDIYQYISTAIASIVFAHAQIAKDRESFDDLNILAIERIKRHEDQMFEFIQEQRKKSKAGAFHA